MESNDELKNIDIKNRTSKYLDDIIEIKDFDFHSILKQIQIVRKYFGF